MPEIRAKPRKPITLAPVSLIDGEAKKPAPPAKTQKPKGRTLEEAAAIPDLTAMEVLETVSMYYGSPAANALLGAVLEDGWVGLDEAAHLLLSVWATRRTAIVEAYFKTLQGLEARHAREYFEEGMRALQGEIPLE